MPRPVLTLDEILAILPETPRRIAALTEGVAAARLHASPEPGAWSVNDVLAHLRACHDVLGGNMIRIVSEDRPAWKGMSPRAWIRKTDYPTWEFTSALEAFRRQRAELLIVIESMSPDDWERTAVVRGMVGETFERSARYYADWMAAHEHVHWSHIGRILAATVDRTRA